VRAAAQIGKISGFVKTDIPILKLVDEFNFILIIFIAEIVKRFGF
jgi:hypothetical protein